LSHKGGGTGIKSAYCKEDAPAYDYIECYLDYDGTLTTGVLQYETAYIVGDVITGTDGNMYRCILAYTSSVDGVNDNPITGVADPEADPPLLGWESYWALITEIDVYCDISGGGILTDAIPHLLTLQTTAAWDGTAPQYEWKKWTLGELFAEDNIVLGSDNIIYKRKAANPTAVETALTKPITGANYANHWETASFVATDTLKLNEKEYFTCILLNDGDILNWPYGDDGDAYWECMFRKADELQVIVSDGVYKALGRFQAAFEQIA
jgi:hypothetical protein